MRSAEGCKLWGSGMLCKRCKGQAWDGGTPQRLGRPFPIPTCDRCSATIFTLDGVVVRVGDQALAQLARFGLAETGEPLLELKREDT